MTKTVSKAMTHREFLKMCGLAAIGAGAVQMVLPPKPAFAADQTIDGNLYVTGSIGVWKAGIGMSPPPARLIHIAGDGSTSPTLPGIRIKSTISGGKDFSLVVGSVGVGFYDEGDSTYPFLIKGSGQTGAGNVGVGTTAPSQKLDVAGNIQISGGDRKISLGVVTAQNIGVYFGLINDQYYFIGRDATAWGSGQPLIASAFYGWQFRTGGQNRFAIDGVGNVSVNGILAIKPDGVAAQAYYA